MRDGRAAVRRLDGHHRAHVPAQLRVEGQRGHALHRALAVAHQHHRALEPGRVLQGAAHHLDVVRERALRVDLHLQRLQPPARQLGLIVLQVAEHLLPEQPLHHQVQMTLRLVGQHRLALADPRVELLEAGGGLRGGRRLRLEPAGQPGAARAPRGLGRRQAAQGAHQPVDESRARRRGLRGLGGRAQGGRGAWRGDPAAA